jgi:nitrite reductase/ring-hydroxylating ferredoxin subunit
VTHEWRVLLQVVELGGSKVLIVGVGEDVYAVSNKCSHLGLPIVGKWSAELQPAPQQHCRAGQ